MIRNTFTFIPGIGDKTEGYFWKHGILTWDDLTSSSYINSRSRVKSNTIDNFLNMAHESLKNGIVSFFAEHLPQKDYWRLYRDFQNKTLFLDIETTGLSLYYDSIVLIGTFDGQVVKIFVKDHNIDDIVEYFRDFQLLVTFNGKLFDIPFLKKRFSSIQLPPIHLDLRFLLRQLGLTGSLKAIERQLHLHRDKNVLDINGRQAAVLGNRFLRGDYPALEKLVSYNLYDIINLKNLMDHCYLQKVSAEILPRMLHPVTQQKLFEAPWRRKLHYSLRPASVGVPRVAVRQRNDLLRVEANDDGLLSIDTRKITSTEVKIRSLIRKIESRGYGPLAIGIDLSGSAERASGICILQDSNAYLSLAYTDEEIIEKVLERDPTIISIDSPLSLPSGRCCADDSCECRQHGIMRECERILKKRGINVYPCLIKSMQKLTMRGIKLSRTLEKHGHEVIESYPGAAQDILRFPRKRIDLKELEIDLMNMGIKPSSDRYLATHDELDALTSALVGYFYLAGMYEAIGDPEEGYLVIPDLNSRKTINLN